MPLCQDETQQQETAMEFPRILACILNLERLLRRRSVIETLLKVLQLPIKSVPLRLEQAARAATKHRAVACIPTLSERTLDCLKWKPLHSDIGPNAEVLQADRHPLFRQATQDIVLVLLPAVSFELRVRKKALEFSDCSPVLLRCSFPETCRCNSTTGLIDLFFETDLRDQESIEVDWGQLSGTDVSPSSSDSIVRLAMLDRYSPEQSSVRSPIAAGKPRLEFGKPEGCWDLQLRFGLFDEWQPTEQQANDPGWP